MAPLASNPQVHAIFDPATWTLTYVVHNGPGTACAIIDSVLDYDPKSGRTRTTSADKVIAYVTEQALQVEWILETHAHADHLTAAPYLKQRLGGKTAIGSTIYVVIPMVVSELTPQPQRAAMLAIVNSIVTLGGVIAPFAMGVVVQDAASRLIGYDRGFTLLGGLLLAGGVIGLLFIRPEADRSRLAG